MRKIALALAILGTTLVSALYTAPAHAQATRTWVSGVGDDANPCSRTAPCKTWAGAISKTLAGGEIDALDPGGFGALTITKPITLDGGGGQVASVLVAGTNGITVAAGSGDTVILRNLRFDGLLCSSPQASGCTGSPGLTGISFVSGAQLVIDNCDIFGFNTNGISVAPNTSGTILFLEMRNTTLRNNTNAISATSSSGVAAIVQVYNSSFVGGTSSSGTPSNGGITAGSGGFVTVANSNFQDLNYGAQVTSGGSLSVDSSLFSGTISGILTASGTTASASNNSFYSGAAFGGSGTVNTANNNKIGGTASVGSATVNTAGITVK
jgi:hypothetical protein